MSKKYKLKIGQKCNMLTVIDNVGYDGKALCVCECGKEKRISSHSIKYQRVISCGCHNREQSRKRMEEYRKNDKNNPSYDVCLSTKHPTYNAFVKMKKRGEVCDTWKNDYEEFYNWSINNGWQKGLVLRIKDNNKEFSPQNCFWGKRYNKPDYNKIKQTCMKKYGVENYTQSKEHKDKYKATCLKKYGVEHVMKSSDIKQKIVQTNLERYGTPYVFQTSGKEEKILRDWLCQYGDFVSDYKILNGKEIDCYNEKLKLGIEYCGLYWHNEQSPQPRLRNYHYNKYRACLQNNVRLITIFSDEWLYRQEQVKGFLLSVLGFGRKFYARKCNVKEITRDLAKDFIEKHHIQGCKRKPKIAFGIFYKEKLFGVMSLDYHPRNNSLVLNRLVFKSGINIVGGASKLFSCVIKWCKKNNINEIISWSDNRWSQGNVYEKMGFKLDKELGPDYSYTSINNSNKRIPKQKMKKGNIGCPDNMTEKEFCLQNGYARIWDCGKKRYVYYLK